MIVKSSRRFVGSSSRQPAEQEFYRETANWIPLGGGQGGGPRAGGGPSAAPHLPSYSAQREPGRAPAHILCLAVDHTLSDQH